MKKIIFVLLIAIVTKVSVFAQCDVDFKNIYKKYCKGDGIYLKHYVMENNTKTNHQFVLKKGNEYEIYLLNPSKSLPQFKLEGDYKYLVSNFNKDDNYTFYRFIANSDGKFNVDLKFENDEPACVLMVIRYISNEEERQKSEG